MVTMEIDAPSVLFSSCVSDVAESKSRFLASVTLMVSHASQTRQRYRSFLCFPCCSTLAFTQMYFLVRSLACMTYISSWTGFVYHTRSQEINAAYLRESTTWGLFSLPHDSKEAAVFVCNKWLYLISRMPVRFSWYVNITSIRKSPEVYCSLLSFMCACVVKAVIKELHFIFSSSLLVCREELILLPKPPTTKFWLFWRLLTTSWTLKSKKAMIFMNT